MNISDEYFRCLREKDLAGVLRLFTPDAVVHSPLYGVVSPDELYSKLFAETSRTEPRVRRVFRDGDQAIAFWFDYAWSLDAGASTVASAVDVAELSADGLIERLYIIYDTGMLTTDFRAQATTEP